MLEGDACDLIAQKVARLESACLIGNESPSESTFADSLSAYSSDSPSGEEEASFSQDAPTTLRRQLSHKTEYSGLDSAVEAARRIYRETWIEHSIERDAGKADRLKREDRADKFSERRAAEKYTEMRGALVDLLPFMGTPRAAEEGNYDVVDFQGRKPPRRLRKRTGKEDEAILLKAQLEHLRSEPAFRAWEASAAVMAAVSTRKEKCWLDAHDTFDALETMLPTYPSCKSRGSAQRKQVIRQILEEKSSGGNGFFANYLVHDNATLRVALARDEEGSSTPAALVVTARMPLFDALRSMDDKGPLRGDAADRKWCRQKGRQFAFQVANLNEEEDTRNARAPAAKLRPDAVLRDLLRSRKPVVLLEVVAALAPRDMCKEKGYSEIVKAELARVTREAKSRGEAVVFCLGSDSPHKLAEKVYLRQPIGKYGLQCGYMRWRASEGLPWARERVWDERITLCLQMP
eukprot:TRINITY_DN1610_c0_g2_i1.p1 TRINITY_DN1610_c0_g2~~TRINITY_DN1610_c0_g2_i1.p1  ORF type:complete len:515 (-),score=101.99 TRINITY_DN1610_c0_g2_i1:56-1441(-)